MTTKAKIEHTSKTIQLMREKLFLKRTHHLSDGIYFIRFGKEGYTDWWGIYRDGDYYSLHKINNDVSFNVAYKDTEELLLLEPAQVVELIKEKFEKIAHYNFDLGSEYLGNEVIKNQ